MMVSKTVDDIKRMYTSTVDVIIIGAGPAGLISALWMARRGIRTRVIERRPDEVKVGGADGIKPRVMEIFESFGLDQNVSQQWAPIHDWAVWREDKNGEICRQFHASLTPPLPTRWSDGALQQGIIEKIIKQHIAQESPEAIEYETVPTSIMIDKDLISEPNAYPCVVTLGRQLHGSPPANPTNISYSEETVRAKYIIGADGANSWTRKQLQFTTEKVRTSFIWGVIDMRVLSDFPDIDMSTTIYNHVAGGLFFIRRERDLNRFYVQLTDGRSGSMCRESISRDLIIDRIKSRLKPYTLTVEYCEWWSTFTIARSLSSAMAKYDRVFLVGDAVHSHSPLAGLGMNISIQDSYNLGWKLAGVIRGELTHDILRTYEIERRPIAKELLQIDGVLFDFFNPGKTQGQTLLTEQGERVLRFISGLLIEYPATTLTVPSQGESSIHSGHITPGMRFPSVTVSSCVTAQSTSLLTLLRSDGRFHIILFARQLERLESFRIVLQLIVDRALPSSTGGLNVITVHNVLSEAVKPLQLDEKFLVDKVTGDWDHTNVHYQMHMGYDAIGIDDGTVVVVRPDQYVGWCGSINDEKELESYLQGIFIRR